MPYFKAKMHEIRFRLGLHPRSRWASLQCSPDSLAGLKGPTSKGKEGKGRRREREREATWEGEWGSPTIFNFKAAVVWSSQKFWRAIPYAPGDGSGKKNEFFHLKWRIFVNFEWNYWSAPLQRTVMQAIWCLTFWRLTQSGGLFAVASTTANSGGACPLSPVIYVRAQLYT